MKFFLLNIVLIGCSHACISQDTCVRDVQYDYSTKSMYYHENGVLGLTRTHRNLINFTTKRWNSCGELISKTNSGKTLFRRIPRSKRYYFYYENGQLSKIRFVKVLGCRSFKKTWVKERDKKSGKMRKVKAE